MVKSKYRKRELVGLLVDSVLTGYLALKKNGQRVVIKLFAGFSFVFVKKSHVKWLKNAK